MKNKQYIIKNIFYIFSLLIMIYLLYRWNNILNKTNLNKKSLEIIEQNKLIIFPYLLGGITFLLIGISVVYENIKYLIDMILYDDYIYIYIILSIILEFILLIILVSLIQIPILKFFIIFLGILFLIGYITTDESI